MESIQGSDTSDPNLDWDSLFSGKVIVEAANNRDNVPGLLAFFTVSSSRERIWSVLTDYEHFNKIFKGTKKAKVETDSDNGATVEIEYEKEVLGFIDISYKYTLIRSYVIHGELITWERKTGDFRIIQGSWRINDTNRPGTFLLIYESYLDGDWFFPTRLVRNAALDEARDMAKHLRFWIENPNPR